MLNEQQCERARNAKGNRIETLFCRRKSRGHRHQT